jgi:hypothetical protein
MGHLLAILDAFPTLSCILFKLKHSWNTQLEEHENEDLEGHLQ